MPWESAIPVLIWAVISIPLTVLLWIKQPKDKLTTYFILLDFILVEAFFLLTVNWAVVNYYLRALPVLMVGFVAFRLLTKTRRERFLPPKAALSLVLLVVGVLLLPATGYLNYRVTQSIRISNYPGQPSFMLFPLRRGLYVTLNGGNGLDGWGMNNYYQDWLGRKTGSGANQIYAYDFGKLSEYLAGTISNGVLPKSFLDYYSFQETVYSPCNGTVDYVVNNLPNIPPFTSKGQGLGNMIVIKCVNNYVTMSNLQHDSVIYKVGDTVNMDLMVASIGNSADNTFPHLHMFVTSGSRDGTPVPILFEKLFLASTVDRWVFRNLLFLR
jgi:Peptidase family M23